MLTQEKLQGDQQATALSCDFEEFLRKQTDVRDRYEVLLNQRAILLEQQRDLLARRKGMRDKSNYDVLIEFFC